MVEKGQGIICRRKRIKIIKDDSSGFKFYAIMVIVVKVMPPGGPGGFLLPFNRILKRLEI